MAKTVIVAKIKALQKALLFKRCCLNQMFLKLNTVYIIVYINCYAYDKYTLVHTCVMGGSAKLRMDRQRISGIE
jgi:hypothetical protein